MGKLHALILGIVQGLTEFLPISSSAHLKLTKLLMGIPESGVVFDLFCHFGTLLALIAYMGMRIIHLLRDEKRQLGLYILAILPLFPAYFLLGPLRTWASRTDFLGFFLIATGLILFTAERLRFSSKGEKSSALWIGAAQAMALIPGVSRSASTLSCARCLGWNAARAVEFSFLLAIPTVMGGNVLELFKLFFLSKTPIEASFSSCLIGFLSSLAVGALMVRVALRRLSKGNFKPFAWYCIVIGLATTLYVCS